MAIELELLSDTIEYIEYINTTDQANYKDPINIKNVRVQFDKNYNNVDGRLLVTISNVIFIDVLNSQINGKDITDFDMFKVGSLVSFKGVTYTVQKIEYLRTDNGELHHLEIEVN